MKFNDIKILDTTLRDGEQTPGVLLSPENKLLIAEQLNNLGVDIIEVGSAIISNEERAAIKKITLKKITHERFNAEICSYCRIRKEDIDRALDCDVDSIHLVAPVSDLHIRQKLKKDPETVLSMIVEMTEYAKSHDLIVELSGEDASRADMDFLHSVYNAGIEAGADRLCFCDTVGLLVPEKTYEIFSDLSKLDAPISIHCHNDFGYATANTIAALRAGAEEAHVTINGLGERAGNASLEEVVMILESLYNYKTRINLKELYPTSRLVSKLTGIQVGINKAIVGGNAFTHEAGIHAHGLLADASTYEPIKPEVVGRERRIVLGKHAGKSTVVLLLKERSINASDKQIEDIVTQIKEFSAKGKHIADTEFQEIVEKVLAIQKSKIKLEELTVVAGTVIPHALIKLMVNDNKILVGSGKGNGPVDAAFEALTNAFSKSQDINFRDISLDDYHVDAIRGGTDAVVDVRVKLGKGDKTATAHGVDTDIIMASVQAMIAAINRLSS
ncbi:MAG: 2-isopropylmalate synthase [Candidatus Methanoperedens sp.]